MAFAPAAMADIFQSTLPLRRATRRRKWSPPQSKISIHAPLAESDVSNPTTMLDALKFQSTLPLRRATRPV